MGDDHANPTAAGASLGLVPIPGLSAAALCRTLADAGFVVTYTPGQVQAHWACVHPDRDRPRRVDVYGPAGAADAAWSVKATALNYTPREDRLDDVAAAVLPPVAAVRYDGADPERAAAWVAANYFRDGRSTEVGGVRFEVTAGPRHCVLRLTAAPPPAVQRPSVLAFLNKAWGGGWTRG